MSVIIPALFMVPSMLWTGQGIGSFCVPSFRRLTVSRSVKLSVAPVSRSTVSSF